MCGEGITEGATNPGLKGFESSLECKHFLLFKDEKEQFCLKIKKRWKEKLEGK